MENIFGLEVDVNQLLARVCTDKKIIIILEKVYAFKLLFKVWFTKKINLNKNAYINKFKL